MSDVKCTLTGKALRERSEALRSGLLAHVRGRSRIPSGLELRFERSGERLRELAEFVAVESACCAFLDYALLVPAGSDALVLRLTGPAEAEAFLEGAFRFE